MFGGIYYGETYFGGQPPYSGNSYSLPLADSVTSSDAKVITFGLKKADTATSTDAISKQPVKKFADATATTTDAIVKSPVKKPSDSVTSSDAIVKSPVKKFADTITSSDVLSRVVSYLRSLVDTATAAMAISKAMTLNRAESVIITDAYGKQIVLHKSDIVAPTDVLRAARIAVIMRTMNVNGGQRSINDQADARTINDQSDARTIDVAPRQSDVERND
jgi:hypothetical protein